jgi:hypothetical protein
MANFYSRNMLPISCVCENKLTSCAGRNIPTKTECAMLLQIKQPTGCGNR